MHLVTKLRLKVGTDVSLGTPCKHHVFNQNYRLFMYNFFSVIMFIVKSKMKQREAKKNSSQQIRIYDTKL